VFFRFGGGGGGAANCGLEEQDREQSLEDSRKQ